MLMKWLRLNNTTTIPSHTQNALCALLRKICINVLINSVTKRFRIDNYDPNSSIICLAATRWKAQVSSALGMISEAGRRNP